LKRAKLAVKLETVPPASRVGTMSMSEVNHGFLPISRELVPPSNQLKVEVLASVLSGSSLFEGPTFINRKEPDPLVTVPASTKVNL